MNNLEPYEEAQAIVFKLSKILKDLGANEHPKSLSQVTTAVETLGEALQSAHDEARHQNDPLVRMAMGEPLTDELREALRIPD